MTSSHVLFRAAVPLRSPIAACCPLSSSACRLFVLGAYPNALFVRGTPPPSLRHVAALAVDNEPSLVRAMRREGGDEAAFHAQLRGITLVRVVARRQHESHSRPPRAWMPGKRARSDGVQGQQSRRCSFGTRVRGQQ